MMKLVPVYGEPPQSPNFEPASLPLRASLLVWVSRSGWASSVALRARGFKMSLDNVGQAAPWGKLGGRKGREKRECGWA